MDRQHIRDAHVVERYLKGTLSEAEEQAFEEAYLGDPELLEELEAAERLKTGLEEIHAAGAAGAAGAAPRRARWREVVASPRYGIAASLVAVAALASTTSLLLQREGPEQIAELAGSQARLLPLVSVRGVGSPNIIAVPAPDEMTVLLLDAGLDDYDLYGAVLTRDGADVARFDRLTPTYEGFLALAVPGALLSAGEYEIRLSGGRRDWPAGQALDELSRTPLTVAVRR